MSGFVYFIANSESEDCFVKIGFTKGSVFARRDALQTGSPYLLDVLAHAPGTMSDEKLLHARFAAFRAHGEWFYLEGALHAYVADMIKNHKPMTAGPTLWTETLMQEWPA